MAFKRNKPESPRGRVRQAVPVDRKTSTFSYYAVARPAQEQSDQSRRKAESSEEKKTRLDRRNFLSQVPFWIFIAIVGVCLVKFTTLSSNPTIIVLNQTAVSRLYTQPNEVYAKAAKKLLQSNFANHLKLTADSNGISRSLMQQFPELQDISVALPLIGNRPLVYVAVAQPSMMLQKANGETYAINANGFALARTSGQESSSVPVIQDQSGVPVAVGKQVLPKKIVDFITISLFQLKSRQQSPSTMILPAGSPYELDVHIEGKPFFIKFNLQNDPTEQAGAALAVMHTLGSSTPNNYIDVRVPGRAYYK